MKISSSLPTESGQVTIPEHWWGNWPEVQMNFGVQNFHWDFFKLAGG